MIFRICRTSDSEGKGPPCPEAFRYRHGVPVWQDVRDFDDPAKVPFYKGKTDWWYNEGANHRVENGRAVRDMPVSEHQAEVWAVRIDSLDDLMAFVARVSIIVVTAADYTGLPEIEIYDDHRE